MAYCLLELEIFSSEGSFTFLAYAIPFPKEEMAFYDGCLVVLH